MVKFIKTDKKLSIAEVKYWKKVFNANLMIGTEIEQMFNSNEIGTSEVRRLLSPLRIGGSPERFTSPVSEVKSDGSLRNGAEIITPGRKVYGFMEQFSMYQSIYNLLKDEEPIISPRCGWHNHIVLQDYGANALERDSIPRVIFDNFMLLLQQYYPALAFITSTMPYEGCHTRYAYFNATRPLKYYDTRMSLREIRSSFSDRYNAINIRPMVFDIDDDKIKNFHVEFRFPDGTLFPAQMAALNILFKSIVLKAINLSKYGTIEFDNSTENLYCFKNNGNDYDEDDDYSDNEYGADVFLNSFSEDDRMSAMVLDDIMRDIFKLSSELIDILEPEIINIDKLALPLLKTLSKTPISMMFKEQGTDDLRVINDMLEEIIDENYKRVDEQVMPLMEVIDLGMIKNTETVDEWFEKAGELVSFKEPIENLISRIREVTDLGFDKNLGFYFK